MDRLRGRGSDPYFSVAPTPLLTFPTELVWAGDSAALQVISFNCSVAQAQIGPHGFVHIADRHKTYVGQAHLDSLSFLQLEHEHRSQWHFHLPIEPELFRRLNARPNADLGFGLFLSVVGFELGDAVYPKLFTGEAINEQDTSSYAISFRVPASDWATWRTQLEQTYPETITSLFRRGIMLTQKRKF